MRILVPVIALSLVVASIGRVRAQSADDTIEKYLTAIGGRAALTKITSRKATGTLSITSQMGALPGTVESLSKAPNKTRSIMTLNLRSVGAPDDLTIDQRF